MHRVSRQASFIPDVVTEALKTLCEVQSQAWYLVQPAELFITYLEETECYYTNDLL